MAFNSGTSETARYSQPITMFTRGALVLCAYLIAAEAACTFPSQLTGSWVRGRDGSSLTFTSGGVSGVGVVYRGASVGDFRCDRMSSGRYIIVSEEYFATFGQTLYYVCWQLEEVSDNAFILYELSNEQSGDYNSQPGLPQPAADSVDTNSICSEPTSAALLTTLVKSGIASAEVSNVCPPALLASFSYGSCSSPTLEACTESGVLQADYTACSDTLFGSTSGRLSCVGSGTFSGSLYVNLYSHDTGNALGCLEVPNTSDTPASMNVSFYSTDCASRTGSPATLELTLGEACPGSTGVDVGAVVGGVLGALVAVAAIAALVFYFYRKNKNKVSGETEDTEANKPKKEPEGAITANGDTDTKIPEETPRFPHGLPPLDANGSAPTGEPLRG